MLQKKPCRWPDMNLEKKWLNGAIEWAYEIRRRSINIGHLLLSPSLRPAA